MADRILKVLRLVASARSVRALIAMRYNGFVPESGWWRSYLDRQPVDASGNPLPWTTYPFIRFVGDRLLETFDLFEFGAGNSTLYFARRVRSVTSVEHDRRWYEELQNRVPSNVALHFIEDTFGGRYASSAVAINREFHIMIVDGPDRVNCVRESLPALRPDGVLVLDDAERIEYEPAIRLLHERQFNRLDFWGIAPGMLDEKCTTLFYRSCNCLNI